MIKVSKTASGSLTIGEVADRTGVSAATLRMWELRHGFPRPARLDSGHRRYTVKDVEEILDVYQRANGGVRLDVAIAQASRAAMTRLQPDNPSVFAELRRLHPALMPHRLRKATLLALSWAIEDEFCARSERAHLFAGFQEQRYFESAHPRWAELARVARSAFVFADFDDTVVESTLVTVPVRADAPLSREWMVVCDAPGLAAALSAWELPGQGDVADRDRIFEAVWTVDPVAVRDAARICAQIASSSGAEAATPVLYDLAGDPPTGGADLVAVTSMFNRVVAYVDRFGGPVAERLRPR